ncbi:phosphoenolpyruvate--protein phosphotransferase [bacterium]|nr:phosphoenolpyruvate--protein phosphotransferase [bacterium]
MLKGSAISPGYAIGKACCVKRYSLDELCSKGPMDSDVEEEIENFSRALLLSKQEVVSLLEMAPVKSGLEITNIFHAYLALIDDPDLKKEVIKRIREKNLNAESAIVEVIRDYNDFFRCLPDPQFQEKAIDIIDVGKRILRNCQNCTPVAPQTDIGEGIIIVSEDLTPSDVINFNTENILGIVVANGTATSHASILARSLGIPALIQVKNLMTTVAHGSFLIVDGNSGTLICNPSQQVIQEYNNSKQLFEAKNRVFKQENERVSMTTDGVKIKLNANISQAQDVSEVLMNQADGIGLYRTEFTYLICKRFPSEEELFEIYWSVVERLDGAEVVIRTIDLGGDKISHLFENANEKNPELGWRAVRMSLDRQDIFKTQLRAILRVCAKSGRGNVKILVPMISNLQELRQSKNILTEVSKELISQGVSFSHQIPLGVMIEVPSAAILSPKIAKEVDFLSIGSNDLIQYTLAVDRTNARVAHLYQPLNPAVLQLIRSVVLSAGNAGKPLSLCGELAGDRKYTLLLIGLGLRELSMNALFIPGVKQAVRSVSTLEIEEQVLRFLDMDTAEEVEESLLALNAKFGIQ